jgi:hypothetical protein
MLASNDRQFRMQQRELMVIVLTISHFVSICYCPHLLPLRTVPPYSWAVLVCLLLVYISNQWTRNILPYVVNFNVADTAESSKVLSLQHLLSSCFHLKHYIIEC